MRVVDVIREFRDTNFQETPQMFSYVTVIVMHPSEGGEILVETGKSPLSEIFEAFNVMTPEEVAAAATTNIIEEFRKFVPEATKYAQQGERDPRVAQAVQRAVSYAESIARRFKPGCAVPWGIEYDIQLTVLSGVTPQMLQRLLPTATPTATGMEGRVTVKDFTPRL